MRIGYFTPAYRSQIRIETAYTMVRDCMWAASHGHEIQPFYRATCNIDAGRNLALGASLRGGADLLLMIDADVYVESPASALALLVERWRETGAAVVGAAVASRRGGLNCERPAPEAQTWSGEVGTGLMLIDCTQLRSIDPPWFVTVLSPNGETVQLGEDLGFCRKVASAGLTVIVDATVPTRHVGEVALCASEEMT